MDRLKAFGKYWMEHFNAAKEVREMIIAFVAALIGATMLYLTGSGFSVPTWLESTPVIWVEFCALIWGFGYLLLWRPFVRHEEVTKQIDGQRARRAKRDALGNHWLSLGETVEKLRQTDSRALSSSGLLERAQNQMSDLTTTLLKDFDRADIALIFDTSTMQRTPVDLRAEHLGGQHARNKQILINRLTHAIEGIQKIANRLT